MKNGAVLETEPSQSAYKSFIKWIKKCKEEGEYDKVVLCAHGALDMPVLLNNLARNQDLSEFKSVVDRFVNSEEYFFSNFPDWKKYGISSMYKELLGHELKNAHDALEDASALRDIMIKSSELKRTEKDWTFLAAPRTERVPSLAERVAYLDARLTSDCSTG